MAVQLDQRTGALDAGWTAADDDDVQRSVVDQRGILVGCLPATQHVRSQAHGVRERVQRKRVLVGALDAEVVDLGSERDDEVVVGQRGHLAELHGARREVDRSDRRLVDGHVRLLVEEATQRVPDRGGLEQVCRDLVQQRLERVVVVLVHENDVGAAVLQARRRTDPAETSTEDQDSRLSTLLTGRHPITLARAAGRAVTPMG